jgi:hypothetical protein
VWDFLGAALADENLHQALLAEMTQNPDADWQQQKAKDIAQSLQKGKRGSWRELFTARDRQVFRQVADETLLAWGYEATP